MPGRRRRDPARGRRRAPSGTPRTCTRRIASRPARSGGCTATRRSKRPGRSSAWSSTSGRFVAPITITLVDESNPSISVRIWLSVCSRSSLPPLNPPTPLVRERPIASSSSMNTIAGAASFACLNRSRTREAPTPTIASTNSEAAIEKNGTSASPATARASSVLPVPGGPESSTPCGIRPPSRRYFSGWRRKSTTSRQLLLRLVDAGDVGERHAVAGGLVAACARAAERAERVLHVAGPPHQPERAARRTGSSGRTRAAGSATTAAPCRAAGVDGHAVLLEQLRERVGVRERRDLRAELRRRLRPLVAQLLGERPLDRRALRGDRRRRGRPCTWSRKNGL